VSHEKTGALGRPFSFRIQDIATNGATLQVRVGGTGSAVVLLYSFGDTRDTWATLADSGHSTPRPHRAQSPA